MKNWKRSREMGNMKFYEMNMATLLNSYKETSNNVNLLAVEGFNLRKVGANKEYLEQKEKEFYEMDELMSKIAVEIANRLTDTKKIQFEVKSIV